MSLGVEENGEKDAKGVKFSGCTCTFQNQLWTFIHFKKIAIINITKVQTTLCLEYIENLVWLGGWVLMQWYKSGLNIRMSATI